MEMEASNAQGGTMSSLEKKEPRMLPAAVLADNFETWMACWSWKWVPEKKGEVDLFLATKFPLPTEERVAQRIAKSGLSTPPATPSPPQSRRRRYLKQINQTPPPLTSSFSSNLSFSLPSPYSSFSSTSSTKKPPVTFTTEYFEVKKSPKKGYGAFAVKDIKKDTVIMTEAPMFKARFSEVFHELDKLTKEQRQQYHTLAAFTDLAPGSKTLAIFKTNRFETSDHKGGIFFKSSRFNHACHPYTTCKYFYDAEKDLLVITACQDIKEGQEITISYTTSPTNLPGDYGFFCDCPACPKPSVARAIAKLCKGPE